MRGASICGPTRGCDRDDPATWTHPVIRLGDYAQEPFRLAVNTPRLLGAFDDLVGAGRWLPRGSLGTFPIRFPSSADPGDAGWHVDASFEGADGEWRINVTSRGRALLMLFLFSDVGEADAPTRIRVGSHRDVAKLLAPAGERGLEFMELARVSTLPPNGRVALATGEAGTVYLCHPFLVHAAQTHRGAPGICAAFPGTAAAAGSNAVPTATRRCGLFAGRGGDPPGSERRIRPRRPPRAVSSVRRPRLSRRRTA